MKNKKPLIFQGSIHLFLFFLIILVISSEAYTTTTTTARRRATTANNLVKQFLAPQNAARSTLGMRPLVWNAKLARYAERYANQRRRDCALKHSNGPYGENIFWGSGNGWTPAQAAMAWASERKWYNYWSNSCAWGQECGHYTQIVWKGTMRVGCARVICFGGKGVFMICNYDPPGNWIGEKPY